MMPASFDNASLFVFGVALGFIGGGCMAILQHIAGQARLTPGVAALASLPVLLIQTPFICGVMESRGLLVWLSVVVPGGALGGAVWQAQRMIGRPRRAKGRSRA